MDSRDRIGQDTSGAGTFRLRSAAGGRRFITLADHVPPVSAGAERLGSRAIGQVQAVLLRAANFLVALAAVLILLPVILLINLAIKLDSPGPIVYRQLRIGLDRRGTRDARDRTGRRVSDLGGRPFMLFKYRTMQVDAELDSGPVWAAPDDARATRAGRWLRKTRLDEIPQFWNVLKGEMSVVGPRPERPNFVIALQRELQDYRLRNRVLPGITGWAQVNRGTDQSLDDVRVKLDYDLEYVRKRSLWFDLLIMLKTLPVMFERDKGCKPE
jgi:lipopolysaccharide/colanic/teichoic acid biosynthesis glycosyltransferase